MNTKKTITILILSTILICMAGCTSNNKEFNVGNSSFILPGDFKIGDPSGFYTEYGNVIDLNNSGNVTSITVIEFFSKDKMDKEISDEFLYEDSQKYFRSYNKTINNTRVWVFDDLGFATRTYFFEKNGKYYMVDIFFKNIDYRDDYIGKMIINSLK